VKHYDKISGWFNHEIAYDYLVSQVPTGGKAVDEKFPNCKVIKGCWIHHKNI
jgi:hypothetical protein